MDIRHLLITLYRHKATTGLIVLQIALCCALVCNVMFLVAQRIARIQRPSGVDEARIVTLQVAGENNGEDAFSATRSDVQTLRAIPGVIAASETNLVPFGNGGFNSALDLEPDQQAPTLSVSTYMGGDQLLDTLGLTLIQGRRFTADEFVDQAAFPGASDAGRGGATIVSRSVADKLFAGRNAVGRVVYGFDGQPLHIVGVVDRLVRARDNGDESQYEDAILLPARLPFAGLNRYVLRVEDPGRREAILAAATVALTRGHPDRSVIEENSTTLEHLRDDYYRQDATSAAILVVSGCALLAVTAFGIVALASFWVRQRHRQIGVRRALGATRGDILRYFQTENFLLTGAGIALGMLLTFAINQWLMRTYALPRLPIAYLPIGALVLWALGQAAVYGPARQASTVPPAEATRTA